MTDQEKYKAALYAVSKMQPEELVSIPGYYLIYSILDYEGSTLTVDEFIKRELKRREMEENGYKTFEELTDEEIEWIKNI